MTWWSVTPEHKKSVEEREYWENDNGDTIVRVTGWRWGTVNVETTDDNPPELGGGEDKTVEMYSIDYEFEFDSCHDGVYGDIEFPEDMPEEERERLQELWDEESYSGWEEEGWNEIESELYFSGPLVIERIKD